MPSSILECVRAIFFADFVKEFVSRVRQQKVLSLHMMANRGGEVPQHCAPICTVFILHAAVRYGADQRKQLEGPCLYTTRPATRKVCNAGN